MEGNTNLWFVVDSSYMLSFLLPDESIKEVEKVFDSRAKKEIKFISTKLLPFEVINGLNMAKIRKRLTLSIAGRLLKEFKNLNIILEEVDYTEILLSAHKNGLTVYDASYLALSKFRKIPLLTLDKRLKNAASSS